MGGQGWGRVVREWPPDEMTFGQRAKGRKELALLRSEETAVPAEAAAGVSEAGMSCIHARKSNEASLAGGGERREGGGRCGQRPISKTSHVRSFSLCKDLAFEYE